MITSTSPTSTHTHTTTAPSTPTNTYTNPVSKRCTATLTSGSGANPESHVGAVVLWVAPRFQRRQIPRRSLRQWRVGRDTPGCAGKAGAGSWVFPVPRWYESEDRPNQVAQAAVQPLVARGPLVAHSFADSRVIQADGQPDEEGRGQLAQPAPQPVRKPRGDRQLVVIRQVEYGSRRVIVLQHVAAHVIPVDLELLPGLRHRPHAHPVHPIPLDVFVEELALVRFGHTAAEPFRRHDGAHEERGVSPVEDVGVQRV